MTQRVAVLTILLILVLLPALVKCEEDVLDLLDAEVAADAGVLPGNERPEWLRNLRGALRLRSQHYFSSGETDALPDCHTPGRDVIEGKADLSTWQRFGAWRVDAEGWLETGNNEDTRTGGIAVYDDDDTRRRHLEINELYGTLSGSNWDLYIGKRVLSNGSAPLHSTADRYSPKDYHDPLDRRTLGIWQVRLDLFLRGVEITAAALPVYRPFKVPPPCSRWLQGYVQAETERLTDGGGERSGIRAVREDFPGVSMRNAGWFTRARTTYRRWDLFVSAYLGQDPLIVSSVVPLQAPVPGTEPGQALELVLGSGRVTTVSAGFATTWRRWSLHGEVLHNNSLGGDQEDATSYVFGGSRRINTLAQALGCDGATVFIDYVGESKDGERSGTLHRSFWRFGENDVLARLQLDIDQRLSTRIAAATELDEGGWFVQAFGRYKLNERTSVTASYEEFGGPDASPYGWQDNNDRVVASIEYDF